MISLEQLASKIEDELNSNIKWYELNKFIPNVEFAFNVYLNAGEYKKAVQVEDSNTVIYYINAIMKVLSSDIEGEPGTKGTYNASMTTSIEFLIPFSERTYDIGVGDDSNVVKFGDQVHYMIASLLQAGLSDTINDGSEDYLVGSRFTIPSPGAKEIRALVGESISLTIYGTHYFIASGVNSNQIELYIEKSNNKSENDSENKSEKDSEKDSELVNYERVYATRVGIARVSISEGNIFSGDLASKNTISGTALTVTFDAPLKNGGYNGIIGEYLLGNSIGNLTVKLRLPNSETIKKFTMLIADAGMNGELGLAASINVRLIEAWEGGN